MRLEVPRRRMIKGEVIGVGSASAGVGPHRPREGVWPWGAKEDYEQSRNGIQFIF